MKRFHAQQPGKLLDYKIIAQANHKLRSADWRRSGCVKKVLFAKTIFRLFSIKKFVRNGPALCRIDFTNPQLQIAKAILRLKFQGLKVLRYFLLCGKLAISDRRGRPDYIRLDHFRLEAS